MGALSALLLACGGIDYRAAELQLDLPGRVPEDAEQVRICVTGVGERSFGARQSGLFAFTGLPAQGPVDVQVDLLVGEELLSQGRVEGLDGWAEGELVDCDGDCVPCEAEGRFASPEEASWVLAVRYSG